MLGRLVVFNVTHTVFSSPCLSGGEKETAYQSFRRRASTPFPQILTAHFLLCGEEKQEPLLTTCSLASERARAWENAAIATVHVCLSLSVWDGDRSLPAVCTPFCPVFPLYQRPRSWCTSLLSVHSSTSHPRSRPPRPYGPTILNPPVKSLH
jgi:hypothetical protein